MRGMKELVDEITKVERKQFKNTTKWYFYIKDNVITVSRLKIMTPTKFRQEYLKTMNRPCTTTNITKKEWETFLEYIWEISEEK